MLAPYSPTEGNTLQAFIDKAAKASTPSTITPSAPLLGTLLVNGTVITHLNGVVLTPDTGAGGATPPPPGANYSGVWQDMAGGGAPLNYDWAPSLSNNATEFLQILQFLDNILLEILFFGYNNLKDGGAWAGQYPKSIVDTLGS